MERVILSCRETLVTMFPGVRLVVPQPTLRSLLIIGLMASIFLTLPFSLGSSFNNVAQYGSVDIWTNKGGQGAQQYGGSYALGESITLYFYSSFDGFATAAVCFPDGSCYAIEQFQMYAGQVYSESNVVGTPAGQHQFILQVCPGGAQPTTTYVTMGINGSLQAAFHQDSSCPGDWTWIDVAGGPADIYVSRCWVTPSNPLQEDQVTFYATIGNSGGTAANNVEIDSYVDGNLFSSERQSLSAGSSGTWYSNSKWTAQDGSHTLRVVANADHSVQESNYANNEASCTFFVNPHTIRVTITHTTTSTTTRSQWTTTTSTIQQYTTKILTSQTTVQSTLTASPILTSITTTGLWYTTVYSPVVTTTVTVAQAISNPFYSIAFLILGLAFVLKQGSLEGNVFEDFISRFSRVLRSKRFQKTLTALLLITVSLLSSAVISVRPGFASTITLTSTRSQTLLTTATTSLTSIRYITSSITSTSISTNTNVQYTTITPTSTVVINSGSTSTIYIATTTTSFTTSLSHGFQPDRPSFSASTSGLVIRATLGYTNSLGEDVAVMFVISVMSSGRVVAAPTARARDGTSGIVSAASKELEPDTYLITWEAFRASDMSFSNQISWSASSEAKTITLNAGGWIDTYLRIDSIQPKLVRVGESKELTISGKLGLSGWGWKTNIGLCPTKLAVTFQGNPIGEATTQCSGTLGITGGYFEFKYALPSMNPGSYTFGVTFRGDSTYKSSSATGDVEVTSAAASYKVYVTVQPSGALADGTYVFVYLYDSHGTLLEYQVADVGSASAGGYGTGPYNFEFVVTGSPPTGDYGLKASVIYAFAGQGTEELDWPGCVQQVVHIDEDGMHILLVPVPFNACPMGL